ncbi:hypothetical protein H2198_000229 [Neophaeococcomyces mojaviensis]|uniref:Uncharacterized protein n=1 Tax=Neophaeococcomyces mojaviensis TaxID=3383035 RepID=A0ACC3AKM2_9EURO|nr:hypothetical protein H2198_000229 [Knufia sp. JES_112]
MAAVNDRPLQRPPVSIRTFQDSDFEHDQANIREAMEVSCAVRSPRTWQTYVPSSAYKRLRLSGSRPPMAQTYSGLDLHRETNRSISTRVRRLIKRDNLVTYDPDTIPVLTKREQRKAEKREKRRQEKVEKKRLEELEEAERTEKRKLEELVAYQRKEMHDRISRQLEVNARERQQQQAHVVKVSLRDQVKNRLKRSSKLSKGCTTSTPQAPVPSPDNALFPPHIDDFQNKNELRSWFGPADVEAAPAATTIEELPPAELPAIPATSPYRDFTADIAKRPYDDTFDTDTLPPPLPRSPSPCLSSSLPRRGITLSETPAALNSKQMQCDYCHGAIKMTGFHYACIICDDDDRLYCAKCANGGRTCRHELIERTRNIKRHPTNPQNSERRSLSLEKDSVVSAEINAHAELSACEPEHTSLPTRQSTVSSHYNQQPLSPGARHHRQGSFDQLPVSPVSPTPTDMYRELEAKRREQEVIFREKEVTLREREAMLREREAWTVSRERDAAMVQQMQAAAMLQQCERAAEVGAQFGHVSPISRRTSCCWASPPVSRQSSSRSTADSISLHSSNKSKKPKVELVDTVAALEASVAGLKIAEPSLRTHGNSTKRKASAADNKSYSGGSTSKKAQNNQQRRQNLNKSNGKDAEDNDDEEEGGSPKRQKQDQTADQPAEKLFACPYYKFDPNRYAEGNTEELHYRNCAGGLYRDISRVKQHLKRIHHRPEYYCQRCFEVFEGSDDRKRHYSRAGGCDAKDCPWPERLDEDQQGKIHIKRPRKDPQEQWYEIFSIIFPSAPLPDSAYIEPAQSKAASRELLDQFVQMFDNRLDSAAGAVAQPWLQSDSARQFLRLQMIQTVQDMMRNMSVSGDLLSTEMPSVTVSPVSPPTNSLLLQSRQTSQSSRHSSTSHHRRQHSSTTRTPLLTPSTSCGPPLRPALKVTTGGIGSSTGLGSNNSPEGSANSRHSHAVFNDIRVPLHVQEDQGYDKSSDSWMSGDDKDAMSTIFPVQEPNSATSTSSRKVSFATPPSHISSRSTSQNSHTSRTASTWDPKNVPAPTFLDLMSFWSNHGVGYSEMSQQPALKHKYPGRPPDSAYGTMSHQPSQSSLYQAHEMGLEMNHMTCVDPQMLFVNPAQQSYEGHPATGTETYTAFDMTNAGMNF